MHRHTFCFDRRRVCIVVVCRFCCLVFGGVFKLHRRVAEQPVGPMGCIFRKRARAATCLWRKLLTSVIAGCTYLEVGNTVRGTDSIHTLVNILYGNNKSTFL